MSVLAVDIGNSRVKWCWNDTSRAKAARHAEFTTIFEEDAVAISGREISHVVICSVADHNITAWVRQQIVRHYAQAPCRDFTARVMIGGIRNEYRPPHSLGPDRLAAALGARQYCRTGALLVASFGTATTLDVLTRDDRLLGGGILPGATLMAEALHNATAHLPDIELGGAPMAIPNSTQTAIAEGIVRAQLGALEVSVRMAEQTLKEPVSIIVSGGAAVWLEGRLPATARIVDNLVLVGLLAAAPELE